MQFHGTADRYTLSGATSVANAVLERDDGDHEPCGLPGRRRHQRRPGRRLHLRPRPVDRLHRGRAIPPGPGRSGTARLPIRSDDLYFGGVNTTDWVNLSKVAIPQADEQQRLLANLIETMNLDHKPLPRFWYFPRSLKAVVVATGDDHGNGGTAGRFDQYLANSPAGARSPTGSACGSPPTSSPRRR